MRLTEYLEKREESQSAFARRSEIPQSTVNLICQGKGTGVGTAVKVIQATGGLVSLQDLLPMDEALSA